MASAPLKSGHRMFYVHEPAPRRRTIDESDILEFSTSANHGTKEAIGRVTASLSLTLSGSGTMEL